MANTLNLFRQGAVGFIVWLGRHLCHRPLLNLNDVPLAGSLSLPARELCCESARVLAFDLRLALEDPRLASPQTKEVLAKLRDIYQADSISRQEFLDEFLPWIELRLADFHAGRFPKWPESGL